MPVPVMGVREVGVVVFQGIMPVRVRVRKRSVMPVAVVSVIMDMPVVVVQRPVAMRVAVPLQGQ